jgi:hypothetical protein
MSGDVIEDGVSVLRHVASSNRLLCAVIIVGFLLVLGSAFRFQAPEILGYPRVLTDFDAFHIAGRMAAEGKASDTYHMRALLQAQRERTGTQGFLPWTYPPPFTLVVQGLARLPIGVAFALFTLTSFAFYLWVLHRIAGKWLPATVIAVMPTIILNLRTGQNGFLIAGLIGCFLLAFRDKRTIAGVPLGLMVIKPHLAVGIGVVSLLQRRWSLLAAAGLVALVLLGLSTWIYGVGIWADFGNAVGEARGFLAQGYYQLFRMISIYATAYTLGFSPTFAMALHAIVAVFALAVLGKACVSGVAYRYLAALTCGASLFVSPYAYDYDLAILGIALAFIMPDLLNRCSGREILCLLLLTWLVCGFGIGAKTVFSLGKQDAGVDFDTDASLSLIAPVLAFLCWFMAHLLRRQNGFGMEADARPSTGLQHFHLDP